MRRSWWVAAGAVVALVLAVLLVRPGSQASPDDVAGPRPSGDPRQPDRLAGLTLADVPVRADGIGPLALGDDPADLVAAGWQTYDVGGCVRLLPQELADATLAGWAVDDQVVSLQLEAATATVEQVPTEAGFTFGVPVPQTSAQQLTVHPVGADGRRVTTGRLDSDAGRVLVSDVGGPTLRFVEVATEVGEACTLDADLLQSSRFPSTQVALTSATEAIGPADLGHRYLSSSGSTIEQLASTSGWAPLVAGLTGEGCETVEQARGGDRITLFVLDGVVVAEDYVLDTTPLRTPPYYFPGEAYQETTDGRLRTTQQLQVEEPGPSGWASTLRTRLLVGLEVVPAIDSVVVAVGPLVELQQVGRPCGTAGG
ncbi:hypothetical protein [Aquipuribacter sp. MA13-6]|uniref:hypothetical protein n=1 Tax=unclassified Aquipuribacter TaxID=2635084 RepID=UPI003EEFF0A6